VIIFGTVAPMINIMVPKIIYMNVVVDAHCRLRM
jgi:hypothetical protein